jgi:hypothetical protein
MATYEELFSLRAGGVLKNKVATACIIAAESIMNEASGTANHANRILWSKSVFENPGAESNRMYMAILAANSGAALSAITGATDVSIQNNVDNHVDLFADGS